MIVLLLELWDCRTTREPGETVAPLVLTVAFYLSPFRSW